MKREFFIILLFFIFVSCKKDEEYTPTLDRPTNFNATKGDFVEKIILNWTSSPQANNYEVFRFDSIKNDYLKIGECSNNSYTDSSINKVKYHFYYKVRVFNSKSKFSNYSDIDYGYISAFVKPTNILASKGLYDNYISVSWSSVLGASEYLIYRSKSINGNFELLSKSSINSYNDYNVESDKEYFYKIKAYNPSLGYTDYSETATYKVPKYCLIKSFGTYGINDGQFCNPIGVAVDKMSNIYVTENVYSRRVQKFDFNGNYISTITTLDNPYGILYYEDSLFISKNTPGKIYCFNMAGTILYNWGNGYGSNDDQFKGAWGMIFDNTHNMYLVDRGNNRIKKYNAKKELVSIWTGFENPYGLLYINGELLISDNNGLYRYNLDGTLKSKFNFSDPISCISKDNSNNIYIASGNQIIVMDSQYRVTAKFGTFDSVYGICVDQSNNIVVSDYSASKIYIYSSGK